MSSSFGTAVVREIEDTEHWLSPTDLVAQLDIETGMTVAEIGAGKAFYAIPIARRVGPTGNVFAVEWRYWLLEDLQAQIGGPTATENVRMVAGRAGDTHVPAASCDLVILADIWHELEHHDSTLDEARRILRTNGRLAILNWKPDALCPPGPPIEHRVSMQKTICAVEMKSWSLVKAVDLGVDGYLLVFRTTDESVQS